MYQQYFKNKVGKSLKYSRVKEVLRGVFNSSLKLMEIHKIYKPNSRRYLQRIVVVNAIRSGFMKCKPTTLNANLGANCGTRQALRSDYCWYNTLFIGQITLICTNVTCECFNFYLIVIQKCTIYRNVMEFFFYNLIGPKIQILFKIHKISDFELEWKFTS